MTLHYNILINTGSIRKPRITTLPFTGSKAAAKSYATDWVLAKGLTNSVTVMLQEVL